MTEALRLLVETHPAWQRVSAGRSPIDRSVPALSQTIYTLLGRRGARWHTIVPRIEHAQDAADMLDTANRSQLFDRLVIAKAQGLANGSTMGQPLQNWETHLCAVPHAVLQAGMTDTPSFAALLTRAERQHTRTLRADGGADVTAIRQERNDASLWLLILFATALWSQAIPVLLGVGILSLLEYLYQCGVLDGLVPAHAPRLLHTGRFYLYSLCAGLTALPLLAGLMLRLLDVFLP